MNQVLLVPVGMIPFGMGVALFLLFSGSALVSLFSLYVVRRRAVSWGLVAEPGGHRTHQVQTPVGGGIGIYLGFVIPFLVGMIVLWIANGDITAILNWLNSVLPFGLPSGMTESMASSFAGATSKAGTFSGLLVASTVLAILGLADDRLNISPWLRLAVEFLVAAFSVWGMGFELTAFIQGWPILTQLLSVIWIVAVINSFNMLDNMDALSGGVAAIIAAAMAVVMLVTPDPGTSQPQILVAVLLVALCGSTCGFLWHNRPPAKIFMGDCGSYFLGYLIAVSMLMATFADVSGDRPHAVLAPLCAMAVPLYDMSTVIWIRIRSGKSIFAGDRNHFSHRLVELGLSRVQAVLTIHLVTATCGLAAILVTGVSVGQAIMVLGIVGCMMLLVIILESTSWRKSK